MTKKRIELSIDEKILEKAKKHIPNLSAFMETCLRKYLGVGNDLTPTSKMHELVETIGKCQLELYLMNERTHIEEAKEKAKQHEINLAWRQLYTEYRDTKTINQNKLQHASKTLNVPTDELVDIIEVCFVFSREDGVDVSDWENVYTNYGDGV